MGDRAVDTLVRVARDGAHDDVASKLAGLSLQTTADGFTLVVAGEAYESLSESDVHELLADHESRVREWHFWSQAAPDAPDRRAFIRWIEGALADSGADTPGDSLEPGNSLESRRETLRDGVARAWGQVRVRAELTAAGGRVYELRHVDDTETSSDVLDSHSDPLEARTLGKTDERGRYRPLSTAPTLRRGWVFEDLSPVDVVRAVDAFYPATIANWYREREGDLDVSHWHETVLRQTGIYGLVETWDRGEGHEHVEWVAETCCDDSQCLKRREWEYDDETDLDVDGAPADGQRADGAGVFPCREPCSLVIAGARTWTRLEAEESRPYEFELTPSEKEQVEAIIDAVADGRVEEIREADFGEDANRYRARFLRAKRFENGQLCGVPTEQSDGDESPERTATDDTE